ncbi:MAG: bifunctional demethylmenaquinone methyltransferase/2-methoxy-6-polyprenyl-1,4-benzoquinol methylase UbiE [Bacteroidota bacterium]
MRPSATYNPQTTNVEQMFNDIAPHYDFLNHFLSGGTDKRWRRKAINLLKKYNPQTILDVATGTGDFAIAALKLNPQKITGIDISGEMLKIAEKKIQQKKVQDKIFLTSGSSENLPFPDLSFDAVTVAFGVRNFKNLKKGIIEMHRVLNRKGVAVILEFSKPYVFPMKQVYFFYFRRILPWVGKIVSKNPNAYAYLPETVMKFPQGDEFAEIITNSGFGKVRIYILSGGICSIYLAEK